MEEYIKIKKKMRFLDKKIIEKRKKNILEYLN
ncbi:hypothetical protein J2Z53_001373 [Clostridium moniliforme]|uniref:Uncharacterized protein n=1 Tax=Clostridium moniliforme TaxID=39489 RepID=A0ABS4F0N9_9CLOT|nr:hypothetical protein [Clostridium moniliforme]